MRSLQLDNPSNGKRRDGWNFLEGTIMFCDRVPHVISLSQTQSCQILSGYSPRSFEYLLTMSSLKLVDCSCILLMF
jgi:hypothetical protein